MSRSQRIAQGQWQIPSFVPGRESENTPRMLLSSTLWFSVLVGQSDPCVHGAYRTVCIDVSTTFHAPCAMIQRVLLCGHTGGAHAPRLYTLPVRAVAHVEFPPSRHGDSTMAGSDAVGLLMEWPHGRDGDVHWETNYFRYYKRLGPPTKLATSSVATCQTAWTARAADGDPPPVCVDAPVVGRA